jgi:hypothetical protein
LLTGSDAAPRQMARALAGREDIEAIHIIAHGRAGEVSFGSGLLSLETLDAHEADLAAIGRALDVDGESYCGRATPVRVRAARPLLTA